MESYYYVYETENLTNGKKYIGQHCTHNLNDGYYGSDKKLKADIKSGHQYKVTILKWCKDIYELGDSEYEEIKNRNALKDPTYYNHKVNSGYKNYNFEFGAPFRKGKPAWNKGKRGLQVPWNKGKTGVYSEETLKIMSEKSKISHKGVKLSPSHCKSISIAQTGEKNGFYGKKHSTESLEKNRQAHLGKKHSEETKQKMRGRIPWNKKNRDAKI